MRGIAVWTAWSVLCAFGLISVSEAKAQETNAVTVEGYAFDGKTLRPLANANVSLSQTGNDGGTRGYSAVTDANGFYSITVVPVVPTIANNLILACLFRKGGVQAYNSLYPNLQTDRLYQRNFYLTLPKNVTKCQ